jgi:hypothetical protein
MRLLAREPGAVVGLGAVAIPLALAATPCLIGVPAMAWALGHLVRTALRAGRAENEAPGAAQPPVWRSGAYALLGLAALIGGAALLALVVAHLAPPEVARPGVTAAALLAALAGAMGVGAALAPLSFAPFLVADGVRGVARPLLRSFELASHLGPGRAARLGATAGGAIGLSLLLVVGLFGLTAPDVEGPYTALLAVPFGIVPGPPLAAALLADAYLELRASEVEDEHVDVRVGPRLGALAGLLVPTGGALLVTLVLAALKPMPMRPLAPHQIAGLDGFRIAAQPITRRLPDTSIRVRTTAGGVVVEAADGGGAGAVDAGFEADQVALEVADGAVYGGPAGSFAVLLVTDEARAVTLVDAEGVRLDDGLDRRVLGRLGPLGTGLALAGLVLALLALFVTSSELGRARGLEAPRLDDPRAGRGGLKALAGTLRVADAATIRHRPAPWLPRLLGLRDPCLIVDGEGWLEADGGALRFRLPAGPIPVPGGADVDGWSGRDVVLLSRFAGVAPTGFREAWTPWPADGRLVLGSRADAAKALSARAARLASVFAAPALVALGGATALLLAEL